MKSKALQKMIQVIAALMVVLLALTACSTTKQQNDSKEMTESNNSQTISTDELKEKLEDDTWVIVDTRINDAYNGWKLDGVSRGGHIDGAVDFSANWLNVDVENKDQILDEALKTKNINPDMNIVLYDANGKDAKEVEAYLREKGFKNLFTYDVKQWADDESLPMEAYQNYQMIVPASVVKDILDGKTPETFTEGKAVKIVEASWGEEDTSYAKGHVPTSVHINTDTIEPPPAWMLAGNEELTAFANKYGFTKDDTIIVTGENTMAAYRVAVVLRYMGVQDVRVLNGGLSAWVQNGYEVETTSNSPVAGTDFGATIPANSYIVDTQDELKQGLNNPNQFTLVDNRTWEEHIGETSGYSYHDKKGRIPGSIFGYAGKGDANTLDYYRNIDNTMRNAYEITELWKESGIDITKHLSFMCGSGWRVAEIMTYANVLGLDDVSIYSDGWIGWSTNPDNPVETGEPMK